MKAVSSQLIEKLSQPTVEPQYVASLEFGGSYPADFVGNLLTYSEDFSNADWTKTGVTAVQQTDGTWLVEDVSTSFGLLQQSLSVTDDYQCLTARIKKDNIGKAQRSIALQMTLVGDGGSEYFFTHFDTKTGEFDFSSNAADIGAAAGAFVEDDGDFWLLHLMGEKALDTNITATCILYPAYGQNFVANGFFVGTGVYVDYMQLNEDEIPPYYIKTVASVRPTFLYYPPENHKREENMLLWSESFSTTPWFVLGAQVTANTYEAPDGTTTADDIIDNSSGTEYVLQNGTGFSAGERITNSVYVRKDAVVATDRFMGFELAFVGGSPRFFQIGFDTSNGTYDITNETAGDGQVEIIDYDENWWRIAITATDNGSNNIVRFMLYPALGQLVAGVWNVTLTRIGTVTVWGAQMNHTEGMDEYYKTEGAALDQYTEITDRAWFTSHQETAVPYNVTPELTFRGTIKSLNGQTQRINPDKAQHTIGDLTLEVVDIDGDLSRRFFRRDRDGYGLRSKQIKVWVGEVGVDLFDNYVELLTFYVNGVDYRDGVYTIKAQDIQQYEKVEIFQLDQGFLNGSITATQTTIPVLIGDGANRFQTLAHTSNYSSDPNVTVGYVKIDDEIIAHTGWTDGTYTALQVHKRGALNTFATAHSGNGSGSSGKKVEEYVYMEMPALKMAYAILTGKLHNQGVEELPSSWHAGIDDQCVNLSDFAGIGQDLWNVGAESGRMARIMGARDENAKSFIENELLLWSGCFMPVLSDGCLSLRRFQSVAPFSAYIAHIQDEDIISHTGLKYDHDATINNIVVRWNYIDRFDFFSKENRLIDADSIGRHGTAAERDFEFKGVFIGAQSDNDVQNYISTIRNRYSNPPLRLKITVGIDWNILEVGDVIRVETESIVDYNNNQTVDRAFEVQQVRTNWLTGQVTLDLFGGIKQVPADVLHDSNVLQDSYYTGSGTDISGLLTISAGVMTVSGSLTGGTNMLEYYHDGDLTIASGVTLTLFQNVTLKVKGFLTINGTIQTNGQVLTNEGYLGATSSGPGALLYERVTPVDGIYTASRLSLGGGPNNARSGNVASMPVFNIQNYDGTGIANLPNNLAGEPGNQGALAKLERGVSRDGTQDSPVANLQVLGGAGGVGGGGAILVSRGAIINPSGRVVTSGGAGTQGGSLTREGRTVYAQTGAGGFPGGVLFLIDGNYSAPIITSGNFKAFRGAQNPPAGIDEDIHYLNDVDYVKSGEQAYGWWPQSGADVWNYWEACHRVQYIPEPIAGFTWLPEDEILELPNYFNKPPYWDNMLGETLPDYFDRVGESETIRFQAADSFQTSVGGGGAVTIAPDGLFANCPDVFNDSTNVYKYVGEPLVTWGANRGFRARFTWLKLPSGANIWVTMGNPVSTGYMGFRGGANATHIQFDAYWESDSGGPTIFAFTSQAASANAQVELECTRDHVTGLVTWRFTVDGVTQEHTLNATVEPSDVFNTRYVMSISGIGAHYLLHEWRWYNDKAD